MDNPKSYKKDNFKKGKSQKEKKYNKKLILRIIYQQHFSLNIQYMVDMMMVSCVNGIYNLEILNILFKRIIKRL